MNLPTPNMPVPVITTSEDSSPFIRIIKAALADALDNKGKIPEELLTMEGMSGRKYRYFINNLVQNVKDARYLEIGSWSGSTFCAAIHQNAVKAVAIDNWSQFGGPVDKFFMNLSRNVWQQSKVSIITEDFRKVKYESLGRFNIYLFDGPHKYQDQYDALAFAAGCMDAEFIFIVDDWNFSDVRSGTESAIKALDLQVVYKIEIRTSLDNKQPFVRHEKSDWHNGYLICILRKTTANAIE